jgi:predicted acetyltransferase
VSTATAIINEGCLFLFLVATTPEARCKEYGEAAVRQALQTAHEATGISRTVLHATEAGYPLYLRLGYHLFAQKIAKIRCWTDQSSTFIDSIMTHCDASKCY